MKGHHPQRNWIVGGAVIAAVLVAIGYVLVLHKFNSQAKSETNVAAFGDNVTDKDPNNFSVTGTIVGIDDKTNQMTVRFNVFNCYSGTGKPDRCTAFPSPYEDSSGSVKNKKNGVAPGSATTSTPPPLTLYIVGDTSNTAIPIPAGQSISTTDQPIDLAGSRRKYPFDSYNVRFRAFITGGADGMNIPTLDNLTGGVHGFKIDTTPSNRPVSEGIHVHISRATSTLFFANFTMVSMWALALAGVAIALMLTLKRRDIGTAALGYLAALLFAFPGIRLALPGSPEVGSKFDFLAFFWCETIVALTLVYLAALWITRETRADGQSAELKAIQALADRLEAGAVPAPHREATDEHKSKP